MNTEQDTIAPACPDLPPPAPQTAWLQKFVGEWDNEVELTMEPGQEPLKVRGSESARMIGGFWLVSQGRGDMMGSVFENVLTLGYDEKTGKYIGTWVDSMTSHLWRYEGTVNEAGDTISLDAEGMCPKEPGKLRAFRDVYTFLDADTRLFTGSVCGDDGQWTTGIRMKSRRKG